MSGASRTVRNLRLRAPSEAAVRRAAVVFEDGLRTASLPDGGGRVLLVRRLALGRLAADSPPASIALALERAVARATGEWRHGASAGAGAAAVVWFRDPLDAHLALAQRLLSGPAPDEWYWSLAVPRWRQGPRLGESLREIAFSLAALDEAPAALPRWFAALVASGYGELLAAALRPPDLAPLARAAGVSLEPPGQPRTAAAGAAPHPAAPRDPAPPGERAVRRLIAAMLHAAGRSSVAASFAAAGKASRMEPGSMAALANSAHSPRPGDTALAPEPAAATVADLPDPMGGDVLSPIRDVRAPPDVHVAPRNDWQAGRTPALLVPETTSAGGLLFLLNALARIGYAEWIGEQPAWASHDVARRVLGRVLARLDVAAADPVRHPLEARALPATHPRRFVAPSSWRDGLLSGRGLLRIATGEDAGRLYDASGRLLLGAWRGPRQRALLRDCRRAAPAGRTPGRLDAEVVEAWDVALRRWVRRYARMGLAELVLRPGRLTATPTHVDVRFELGATDLCVRRAGLDLDPGWLPWFGRVVGFHYDSAGEP